MEEMMNNGDKNYYEVLEVPEYATQEQIKENYRRLVLIHHPDKNQSSEAAERFREIHAAYQVLSDVEKRARYDKWGKSYDSSETVIASFVSDLILETVFSSLTPFDTLSKRCKSSPLGTTVTLGSVWKTEGWRGLWRGWTVHVANSYLYGNLRDQLLANNSNNPLGALLVAQTISYPLELIGTCIRTRSYDTAVASSLSTASSSSSSSISLSVSSSSPSMLSILRGVVAKNGMRGLYSGFLPFIGYSSASAYISNWVDTSRYHTWMEIKVRDLLVESKFLGALAVKSVAVLLKAALVALITCPLKTVAVRMQTQALIEPHAAGLFRSVSSMLASEGVKGFYKGYFYDVMFGSIAELVPAFFDLARLRNQV